MKLEMSEMQTTLPWISRYHPLVVSGLDSQALGKGLALIPVTERRLSWNPSLNSGGICFHGQHRPPKCLSGTNKMHVTWICILWKGKREGQHLLFLLPLLYAMSTGQTVIFKDSDIRLNCVTWPLLSVKKRSNISNFSVNAFFTKINITWFPVSKL